MADSRKFAVAAKAFVIRETESHDLQFLMLRCPKDDPNFGGRWEIPGGRVECKESVHDGLKRELREELGLQSWTYRIHHPIDVQILPPNDSGQVRLMGTHLVSLDATTADIKISDEHDRFEWFSLGEKEINFEDWFRPILRAAQLSWSNRAFWL